VARRGTPKLAQLLERFVCVRAVEMEGVDLSLFQFDYDQTWCAFLMNADRTIYGRYGTRATRGADAGTDVSVAGFEKALEAALEVHAGYPGNRASLAGKRAAPPPAKEIRSFPLFKSRFAEAPPRGCAHCHHVWEALRSVPREARKPMPPELMWPYPKPDRLGLALALDERALVRSVAEGSAAAAAGFRAGDRLLALEGQPLLSIADVQWVLQHAKAPGEVAAEVDRGGARLSLRLRLDADWRRGEDIAWRTSTGAMRPFGWEETTPEQRAALGLKEDALCIRVRGFPKVGPGQRAGLQVGDLVVEIDGSPKAMTESRWYEFLYREKARGDPVALTVLRGGKRVRLVLAAP
jgi:serine protease Do